MKKGTIGHSSPGKNPGLWVGQVSWQSPLNFTCYSKYCDHAVCQGQVHEQGGGPLLPHPLPHQGGDGEGVANSGQDHQA